MYYLDYVGLAVPTPAFPRHPRTVPIYMTGFGTLTQKRVKTQRYRNVNDGFPRRSRVKPVTTRSAGALLVLKSYSEELWNPGAESAVVRLLRCDLNESADCVAGLCDGAGHPVPSDRGFPCRDSGVPGMHRRRTQPGRA